MVTLGLAIESTGLILPLQAYIGHPFTALAGIWQGEGQYTFRFKAPCPDFRRRRGLFTDAAFFRNQTIAENLPISDKVITFFRTILLPSFMGSMIISGLRSKASL